MLKYLRFWWQSTNEHGIHSPFIFQWVTLGLYQKSSLEIAIQNQVKKCNLNKKILIWIRMLQYFDPKQLEILGTEKSSFEKIYHLWKNQFPEIKPPEVPYPFEKLKMIVWTSQPDVDSLFEYHKNPPAQTVLIFSYHDKNRFSAIGENFQNTITIDLFHTFVVFYRNEQTAEHFAIRC
jgi:hypothetical protein